MAKNYLALDLGAESGRAMVGILDGDTLKLEERHRWSSAHGRLNGHYHWDLIAQWEQIKTGLRKAAAGTPLAGLGVDTWGVDFGLLDRNGDLLGNPYMYRDSRTEGLVEKACAVVSRQRIFETTGIQFMHINSLYQLLAMRLARSPILDAADALLFMPDLFNYLFTGRKVNEFSIATTSQMYDPRRRNWAFDLLAALDLPSRILREIVPSGTVLGDLKPDVADECGVSPIPVIAPGCHDTASAVAAVPADAPAGAWCYISSGTWSLMGVELAGPLIDDKAARYNYTNEGGVGGSIRFLKNIMGMWLVQECRRHWEKQGESLNYAQLAAMAESARPFVALVDPEHQPFFSPGDMPAKVVEFCRQTGQSPPSTKGEFVRSILESLALTYRKTIEGLEDILGHRIGVIHIVGGGCQNELLNQMTADACARPVVAGPVEATAAGNVLTQAIALGEVRDLAAARAIVRGSFGVKRYEPRDTGAWEETWARYRNMVGS
jgi:sugar (pentulose or hexulose) kinase